VTIPICYASVNGQEWSWCQTRWDRVQFKQTIADAAVDGVIPSEHLRTPAQAYIDTMKWLERLEKGEVKEVRRRKVHIPLEPEEISKRAATYGDFSKMNARINTSYSHTIHARLLKDPEEWEEYHALYREARKSWQVVPYKEVAAWCRHRPHFVVGDFGCGEALLGRELPENVVHSFDHVAINDKVVACDISRLPLENECLDVAVFSLSLMGVNFTDYIKEAHRCLRLDGYLWIAEPTSRFGDLDAFLAGLQRLGFDVASVDQKWKFTFIKAIKTEREMQDITLVFRSVEEA
jgi:hypothetical protein